MPENLASQDNLAVTQEKLASKIGFMNIHRRIKERREALGLSMEALAALVGVKSWQTVQQWEKEEEKGGTAPKRARLHAVADALKTTPEYLLFGQSSPAGLGHPDTDDEHSKEKHPLASPIPIQYSVPASKFRRVFVVGRAQGGIPERIWTDGDYPVGATDEYAEIASSDPHAFLIPVVGTSMVPRFNPGEFALVEPGTEPELEDDVLVRLTTGGTMIKKLVSRRGGFQFTSYNEAGSILYSADEIVWMYYIAHPVPSRKIKTRL